MHGRLVIAKMVQVLGARHDVAVKSGVVSVAELVLLAPLLDDGRQLVVVNVGDTREKMVLDLAVGG